MKKIIFVIAIGLCSCRPVATYGGLANCKELSLPENTSGWDYVGGNYTNTGLGEWYDAEGNKFGYSLAEDSSIYDDDRCSELQGDY